MRYEFLKKKGGKEFLRITGMRICKFDLMYQKLLKKQKDSKRKHDIHQQLLIFLLKKKGNSFRDISAIFSIPLSTVHRYYHTVERYKLLE